METKEQMDRILQEELQSDEFEDRKVIGEEREQNPVVISDRSFVCMRLAETTAPLFGVGMVKSAEIVVMAMMISNLGKEVLAADGLVSTYPDFLMQSTLAFFTPIGPMVGEKFGLGLKEEAGQIVNQGWVLAAGLGVPVSIAQFFTEEFFNLVGVDPELSAICGDYSRVSCFAIPAIFGLAVDYHFVKSVKKEKVLFPFYLVTAGMGAGIFYALTNGFMGIPKQGYTGLGYTILIQSWLTFAAFKVYFRSEYFQDYKLFDFRYRNRDPFIRLCKLGSHLYLLSLADLGTALVSGIMTGWLNVTEIAINQAANSYLKFSTALIDGIRQSSQIHVSRFKSGKDYSNMRRFGNMGIFLEGCSNVIPLTLMSLIPKQMASQFIAPSELEDFESVIRIVFITKAATKILEAMQGATLENLKGLFDTAYPAIVQLLVNLSITLPLTYIMGFVFEWELIGINAAAGIGLITSVPIFLRRWNKLSNDETYLDGTSQTLPIHDNNAIPPYLSLLENSDGFDRKYVDEKDSIELVRRNSWPKFTPRYTRLADQIKEEMHSIGKDVMPLKRRSQSESLLLFSVAKMQSSAKMESFNEGLNMPNSGIVSNTHVGGLV